LWNRNVKHYTREKHHGNKCNKGIDVLLVAEQLLVTLETAAQRRVVRGRLEVWKTCRTMSSKRSDMVRSKF